MNESEEGYTHSNRLVNHIYKIFLEPGSWVGKLIGIY